ncbi:hypothetical protein AAGW05_14730 [Arthrobacter sp. LAPM80]
MTSKRRWLPGIAAGELVPAIAASAERVLARTLDYAKERKVFGTPTA